MNREKQARLLQAAAARAATRPEFLGWVLAKYAELETMTDDALRHQWQLSTTDWTRLQLRLRPRAGTFLPDVTRIAAEFQLDRGALAAVLRRVDAVTVLRANEQPGAAGSLLAARTRKPKPGDASEEKEADHD